MGQGHRQHAHGKKVGMTDFQKALIAPRLGIAFGIAKVVANDRDRGQVHPVKVHEPKGEPLQDHIAQEKQHDGIHQPLPVLLTGYKKTHLGHLVLEGQLIDRQRLADAVERRAATQGSPGDAIDALIDLEVSHGMSHKVLKPGR